MQKPLLSVLAVVGEERSRSVPMLEALAKQTIAGQMEVILVDVAPERAADLAPPFSLEVKVLRHPGSWDWGGARAVSVRIARAPVVAFLEDHTIPEPGWAEEIVLEFERAGPGTTAVCYAFINGSPDTWFYRSVFMAEYGSLAHPLPEGKPPSATANNIAYRRDMLLRLGKRLDDLLELDFFCQQVIGPEFRAVSAPRAIIAHQTNTHLKDLLSGHFGYARLFANRRLRHESWGLPKRLAGALSVPLLVPALRLKRLFMSLRGRSLAGDALLGLPVILLLYLAGSLGEAVGLLSRREFSAKEVVWLELIAPRAAR